jgi:adenylate cyclase
VKSLKPALDRPWRLRLVALALAAAATWLIVAFAPGTFSAVEESVGDLSWRVGASHQTERRLVVIDIDERSVQQEGPWPWPRATVAKLSQKLQEAGVAVQAFDIVFPETKAGDAELAAAWSAPGAAVVVGQIFSLDPAAAPDVGVPIGAVGLECPSGVAVSSGVVGNASSIAMAQLAAGHLTPRVELDGVVRKVPGLICHQGKVYAGLALSALARASTPSAVEWRLHGSDAPSHGFPGLWRPAQWLSSTALPGIVVPVDARGDMRVPFGLQRDALLSISAADVIAGRADARMLRGTVALVGATAFGIGDTVATPLATVASGVEVHAQLIAGLLDRRIVYQPAAASWWAALAAAAVAALLLWVGGSRVRAPVKSLPLAGLTLASLLACAAAAMQLQWGLWVPWSGAALFAMLAATALAAAEHTLTRAQRERLSAHLGAYLPRPMAARLAAIDPSGRLEVDRREVTVMVADIRNFSAFALHRPPEETAAVLHAFSCLAVDVVERHGGVVENLVGDSVVAMWNAYEDRSGHAEQALAAARELLRDATVLLSSSPHAHSEASSLQPLALGIGLESGDAIVGSFGPARRRAHAALGEPVTVAVRLQAMTQDLSLPILIGPRMAATLPSGATEPQGEYLLEGLSRASALHAPAAWAEWAPPETIWPRGSARAGPDGDDAFDAPHGGGRPLISPAPARALGDS